MRWTKSRTPNAMFAVAMTAAMLGAGCSSQTVGADKAGGSGGPVVLRIANTSSDLDHQPAVAHFVERVGELSDGDLRIESANEWADFASDAEQKVVRAVATGEVDLGWVGTRVFDTMDLTGFQALTAPMLVDSYALQDAVIESGITQEMLQGLGDLGVEGLGVLPDALRKPIGVAAPIVDAVDWKGITFGTLSSKSQAEAIRALGATPLQVFGHERAEALKEGTIDGFEFGLTPYSRNPDWLRSAPYLTANVTLWPQMDVVLANRQQLDALSGEQRGWLDRAVQEAADHSAALAATDAATVAKLCDGGARFAHASDNNLAALEEAFAPVYLTLERDPATKAFIDKIRELKQSTTMEAALAIPAGCTGKAPEQRSRENGQVPGHLNGTYRYVITQEDADKVGDTDEGYPQITTIKLKDGELEGGCFERGTYSVEGNRISFYSSEYDATSVVTFSKDEKGNLRLTPVPPIDAGDAFTCFSKVWVKIA